MNITKSQLSILNQLNEAGKDGMYFYFGFKKSAEILKLKHGFAESRRHEGTTGKLLKFYITEQGKQFLLGQSNE